MIDPDRFVYIENVSSSIGLDRPEADQLLSKIKSGKIKKEYIEASSPLKKIILNPFHISKKLITVSEFEAFVVSTSYITESEKEGWGWVWENSWKKKEGVSWRMPFGNTADGIYRDNCELFPVMQISWNDAISYTVWRSEIENKLIRIPSEAEWEIFARWAGIDSMSEYGVNDSLEIKDSLQFVRLLQEKLRDSVYNTGLLWEWTMDWYDGYSPDAKGRDFGMIYKVLRGGSLLSDDIQKTREFRFRRCPTARSPYYSFRIVY